METLKPELRRFERYMVKIRTKVTININGQTSSLFGEASDVSRGGLRLFIPRALEPGTILLLELLLPYNSQAMIIRAIIRNRSGFSYGVEFISATQYQQDILAQVCKALQLLQ